MERDFSPAVKLFQEADILLFCYPVYTFLVPYQLHRFIELLKESGADLSGKVATQISTSKHFYDTTAHQFVKDNCSDLGLPYLEGLSADMDDLLTEKGRTQATDWMEYTLWKYGRRDFVMPAPPAASYTPSVAGVASDDTPVDSAIDSLSATVCYAMEHQLCLPQNFLGVGGMKIFRDLIYLMRGMMRADHKFFKSHGQYDFPQKQWKKSLMIYPVGWLMGNRKLKAKMGSKMNEGMIKAYKQVVDNA